MVLGVSASACAMYQTSLSLLEKLRRSDDREAWERLVALYTPLLRRWLRELELQDADADDLVQEILATIAREAPAFQHNQRPGAFRAWLRQTLVHRVQNFWRARQHRPIATGASSVLERLKELADDASQASRVWDEQHDRQALGRLLDQVRGRFQPKTWDAFHRQIFGGQRADQVAAELGMSLSSVYVARSRVLTALRQEAAGLIDTVGPG
jgi:RNA polymerase sigma-70 factor (ECF subfamily)